MGFFSPTSPPTCPPQRKPPLDRPLTDARVAPKLDLGDFFKMTEETRGAELLLLTDDELQEARRLLLPKRMARHDTAFEARLREACDRADRRRKGVLTHD